jgi:hypothetical protein
MTLRNLTWRNLRGAFVAAWVLCRVATALRRSAFPEVLDRLGLRQALPAPPVEHILRAQADVHRAHRLLPLQRNCLLDSLAAAWLVRRQGYSVPLAIGVKLEGGQFAAHAWLGGDESAPGAQGFRLLYKVPQ